MLASQPYIARRHLPAASQGTNATVPHGAGVMAKAVAGDADWEQAKENFQPLKKGRDARALELKQKEGSEEVALRRRCVLGICSA